MSGHCAPPGANKFNFNSISQSFVQHTKIKCVSMRGHVVTSIYVGRRHILFTNINSDMFSHLQILKQVYKKVVIAYYLHNLSIFIR